MPEESVVSLLVALLRKQRGTVLRAWRLDFDRHKVGRLTYTDFAQACRKLGFAAEARLLWTALRPRDGALDFCELEPTEAANVERLLDCFWTDTGYDLDNAWCSIDARRKQAISSDEFAVGLKQFGFDGDCKLLFRGLDSDGFGKLWRRDFDYLKILAQGPGHGQRSSPEVQALVSWTRQHFEGPSCLLDMMGLCTDLGTGPKHPPSATFSVPELAARLGACGYPGDVAASVQGCVDAEALRAILQHAASPLRAWAEEAHGGAEPLLECLWPELQRSEAARRPLDLAVGDFAARLTALGYDGDARRVAVAVARAFDGRRVSARALQELLDDAARPAAQPAGDGTRGRSPARRTSPALADKYVSPARRTSPARLGRISPVRSDRRDAEVQRVRATSEGRDDSERASTPAAPAWAPWDNSLDLTSEKNRRLHVFSRSYFGDALATRRNDDSCRGRNS